ncbi:hypothetical protein H8356DRAFT_1325380 [Neocallimastix lanati (nom. inval.)]|nr:hypothetical protein H8356DRAFT_1325380 [Neocallimastix sp. JGI-2020a]
MHGCFKENVNFDSIRHLLNLISLTIETKDEFFLTSIGKAENLKEITFNGFDFYNFPKRISNLTKLEILIGDFKNLKNCKNN